MTTVVDPLGTPSITYNRSGKNIQNVIANSGTNFSDATKISHVSVESIVLVDGSGGVSASAVYFDAGFDIGDTVALQFNGNANLHVYDNSGSPLGLISSGGFGTFVLTSTNWIRIG